MEIVVIIIIGVVVLFIGYSLGQGSKSSTPSQPVVNQHNEVIEVAKAQPQKKKILFDNQLPENFVLTEEFSKAFDIMENSKESLFLTGKAGTGKSTLLKYFRSKTKKEFVVLSPTGIAALNVQGQTIHSFFKLPPELITDKNVSYDADRILVFRKLDTIVIDEISMVRADMMDGIDMSLRKHRNNKLPFGGVQMIFIGDLYQLPPVVVGNDLKNYFKTTFGSEYFFSAQVFQNLSYKKMELSQIFRQKDPTFIKLLNNIRIGHSHFDDLQLLNKRVVPGFMPSDRDMFITLATTNAIADGENERRISNIEGPEFSYNSKVEGRFEKNAYPTNEVLKLKKGAQIMTLKNDSGRRWVNGSIGKVAKISDQEITIEINGEKNVIEKHTWQVIEYELNKETEKIEPVVKGSFTQYPLKLAWAVTIHKSQGKTFDQVVIDLGNGAFAHGQTYVALSRCTSFEGIILKNNVRAMDIILDKKVQDYMNDIHLN